MLPLVLGLVVVVTEEVVEVVEVVEVEEGIVVVAAVLLVATEIFLGGATTDLLRPRTVR